jgi:exodeoxyribonuclease-3
MRIISLSVDGIHQAHQQGLFQWLSSQDAAVICLQDLRCQEQELTSTPAFQLEGYYCYALGATNTTPASSDTGVAIYCREIPKAILYGFGALDSEGMNGRYLQADFEQISVGSLLSPNAHPDTSEQAIKDHFFHDLKGHLNKISHKRRDYVICGNWNIAHRPIDMSDPSSCQTLSGCLEHERQYLNELYQGIGYADAFRLYSKEKDEFTYWPSGQHNQGPGLRSDLQVISKGLKERVEYAAIYKSQIFSSHAPVIIDYDIETL